MQVGSETTVRLAETMIEREIDRLVAAAVASLAPITASDAESYITQSMTSLLAAIRDHEEAVRVESNQASARDTDGDGLSDHDEVVWFDTSPEHYDTDRDGFGDGIEIMTQENPNQVRSDRIFSHESPQRLPLTGGTALAIQSVAPVYEADQARGVPPVQLRVQGTGVPNSYLQLYLFSTPTVTTVPVTADGTFSVVLDAPLSPGDHEMYVAYVDPSGFLTEVGAPVSFSLRNGLIVPHETAESTPPVVTKSKIITPLQLHQMVSSLVLVVLGMALLVLGHAVSRRFSVRALPDSRVIHSN
jgi:hypothetical protein